MNTRTVRNWLERRRKSKLTAENLEGAGKVFYETAWEGEGSQRKCVPSGEEMLRAVLEWSDCITKQRGDYNVAFRTPTPRKGHIKLEVRARRGIKGMFYDNVRPVRYALHCFSDQDATELGEKIETAWKVNGFPVRKRR